MTEQYAEDLKRSTEIVLTRRNRVRRSDHVRPYDSARRAHAGSAGRAAAGAVSVGSALSAALTNRRTLGPVEAGLLLKMGLLAVLVGVIAALWPWVIAWPLAIVLTWIGLAWLAKSASLKRKDKEPVPLARPEQAGGGAE
jgi:cardiolipin synthase